MNVENKDLPAFAAVGYDALGGGYSQDGLSKREYFAGLAMQGLLSNPGQIDTTNFEWVAEHAVGYADKLLDTLSK